MTVVQSGGNRRMRQDVSDISQVEGGRPTDLFYILVSDGKTGA